jgi:hypothetical protein
MKAKASMHKSILFAAAFSTVALMAGIASAETVKISGQHTESEIQATCNREGGTFSGGVTGYGCTKSCGTGTCGVECDRKTATCTGSTPSRTSGGQGKIGSVGTVGGVLKGPTGTAPPKTKPPGNLGGVKPITASKQPGDKNQPAGLMRTNEQHTNEQHPGGGHK